MDSNRKLERHHRLNDVFTVKVIERIDRESWIVSLSGTLIQVKNKTARTLREGDHVQVRLKSLNPTQLEFI